MRSILIFPEMYNINEIQTIRKQYNPLAENIRPNISLVFPFKSDMPDTALIQRLNAILQEKRSFPTTFDRLGSDDNGYLWLEADYGKDNFIKLHDQLYEDKLLRPFLRTDIPYVPHITLGKVNSENLPNIIGTLNLQKLSFSTFIDTISIEKILPNNNSDEIYQLNLH